MPNVSVAVCFCIIIICQPGVWAQEKPAALFLVNQKEIKFTSAKVGDPDQLRRTLQEWQFSNWQRGHLLAGVDSVIVKSDQDVYYLYEGPIFKTILLPELVAGDSTSRDVLAFSGLEYQDPVQFTETMRALVRSYSDFGFPFCKITLVPVHSSGDTIQMNVRLDKGPAITFHACEQRDEVVLRDFVIQRITGISSGRKFSQGLLDELPGRLSRLPYLKLGSEPRVLFLGQESLVWLYVQKSNSSTFDLLLGLNPYQGTEGTAYRLTGEGGFDLLNLFKCGEQLLVKYENLSNQSPNLRLLVDFPFIPFFPFGISGSFNMYRYREEYLEWTPYVALSYSWRGSQRVSFSYRSIRSALLQPDTLSLLQTGRLPAKLDYSYSAWGLSFGYNTLEPFQIPRKGIRLHILAEYGTKKFLSNNTLLSYDSGQRNVRSQYDSLNRNTNQARLELKCEVYKSLTRRSILKGVMTTEAILSGSRIAENELYRMGGSANLRGFDEDFYRCSQYGLFSLEYRFLLDQSSFLNFFNDFAMLKQPAGASMEWNYFNGFGLGIQFQTKAGAFKLQYALGTNKNEPIQLSAGKIHFGYTNLF